MDSVTFLIWHITKVYGANTKDIEPTGWSNSSGIAVQGVVQQTIPNVTHLRMFIENSLLENRLTLCQTR